MKQFITNDLSFAAFLSLHGVKLIDASKLGKSFKFTFEHDDKIKKLRLDYVNSESAKFDNAVKNLKSIVFGDSYVQLLILDFIIGIKRAELFVK